MSSDNLKKPTIKSGMMAVAVLLLCFIPFLTGLYTTAEFGEYGLYLAVIHLPGQVVCLGFDMGIAVAVDTKERCRHYYSSVMAVYTFVTVSVVILFVWGALFRLPIPLGVLFVPLGIGSIGSNLASFNLTLAEGKYTASLLSPVVRVLSLMVLQYGAGLFDVGAVGLMSGHVLSYSFSTGFTALFLLRTFRAYPPNVGDTLRSFLRKPILLFKARSSGLLCGMSSAVVTGGLSFAVALRYDISDVGRLAVALLSLEALYSLAVGYVTGDDGSVVPSRNRAKTAAFAVAVALYPALPLLSALLSEDWRGTVIFLAVLAPLYVARVLNAPFTLESTRYGRASAYFAWVMVLVLSALLLLLYSVSVGVYMFVGVYSGVGTVCVCVHLYFAGKVQSWAKFSDKGDISQ